MFEETVATSAYVPLSPVFLSILNPVSLVEESDQERLICDVEIGDAERDVGARGMVSGGVTVLLTVTDTDCDVVVLPAASLAVAVSVCDAFVAVVVFHVTEYGDVVSSVLRFTPFSLNCTPETPTLSEAEAETETEEPETVPLGAVIDTVGGVVSEGGGGGGGGVVPPVVGPMTSEPVM